MESHLHTEGEPEQIQEVKSRLAKLIERQLARLKGKLKRLRQALKETEKADEHLRKGELMKGALSRIRRGQERIVLTDYSSPRQEKVEVLLDKRASPAENMELIFKKYKKLKRGRTKVLREIDASGQSIAQLEAFAAELGNADMERVAAISEQLAVSSVKKKGQARMESSGPRRFTSSDGLTMFVGRDRHENELLSLRLAKKDDIFLHSAESAGSHIIIVTEGRDMPHQTLMEAAQLAHYYSKSRSLPVGRVAYTKAANVTKPPRGRAGLVRLSNRQLLHIKRDDRLLKELLAQLQYKKEE